ncbi:sigma factor, partial [Nocardioides hankookensis]
MTASRRTASFEEFVVATGDRMLRTAVLLTGDRHAAEDLVQSAYAQAFARWRLVSRADNPTAYTRAILTRLFLSDRRRKRVAELPLLPGADAPAASTDPALRLSLV